MMEAHGPPLTAARLGSSRLAADKMEKVLRDETVSEGRRYDSNWNALAEPAQDM